MHGLFFFHITIPVVSTKGGLFEATFVGTSASVPWFFFDVYNGVGLLKKNVTPFQRVLYKGDLQREGMDMQGRPVI